MREVYRKLDRRAKVIRELPKDLCPENKVTPQLAARKSLGLHPEVLILDECQEAYSHPEHGKEFGRLATAIVKRGPALGIILLLATQRPDAASLPTGISANIGIRCCLRVMDQTANDMVLGTSSYKRGIRATEFATKDKGIGYLAGHADDVQVARSCYIDAVAADAIGRRARQTGGQRHGPGARRHGRRYGHCRTCGLVRQSRTTTTPGALISCAGFRPPPASFH